MFQMLKEKRWVNLCAIVANALLWFSFFGMARKNLIRDFNSNEIAVFMMGLVAFSASWAVYQGWVTRFGKIYHLLSSFMITIMMVFPLSVLFLPVFIPHWTFWGDVLCLFSEIIILAMISAIKYKSRYAPIIEAELQKKNPKEKIEIPGFLINVKKQKFQEACKAPMFEKRPVLLVSALSVSSYLFLKMMLGMDEMLILGLLIGFAMYLYLALTFLSDRFAVGIAFFVLEQGLKINLGWEK